MERSLRLEGSRSFHQSPTSTQTPHSPHSAKSSPGARKGSVASPGHGDASPQSGVSPRTGGGGGGGGSTPSEESHIKVFSRVRPFNFREIDLHNEAIRGKEEWEQVPLRSVVEFSGPSCVFLDPDKDWQEKEQFVFDQCFWSIDDSIQSCENGFADQGVCYRACGEDILAQAWKGYNTCFFAYGQTGSGKTYSMMGDPADNPGVIPRLCKQLFEQVDEKKKEADLHRESYVTTFRVEVRYIEIYNELVKDLLWSLNTLTPEIRAKVNNENMKIRSSPATGVFVEHLTAIAVDGWEQMIELIELGNSSRHTAATKMNERSSRSHAIFKVSLRQVTTSIPKTKFEKPTEHIREAQINLVDLAGSERNKKTGATGDRLKEAASINKSLSCLKHCIDVLADNSTSRAKKRIPFRDSHLTSLLMDSLGGNSKTYMLVCLSPHSDNAEETLQTLKYGSRARQIVNIVHVNENAASKAMFDMEDELEKMKETIEKNANSETIEHLRGQIQEQEATIAKIESDREMQEKQLNGSREGREKERLLREKIGSRNLHTITSTRSKKAKLARECVRLERALDKLITLRDEGESHMELGEQQQEEMRDLTESHKQQVAVLDHEIQQWERKQARLNTFKRELIRTVQDQAQELSHIQIEKYHTLLRARLGNARLTVNYSRDLRRMTKEKDEEIKALVVANAETKKKVLSDYAAQEEVLEDHNGVLHAQLDALQAEYDKVDHDKSAQIKKLEEELSQLKKDYKSLSDENSSRLRGTEADWEKKHQQMLQECEQYHAEVEHTAKLRHEQMIASKQEEYETIRNRAIEKKKDTVARWDAQRKAVTEEWEAKINQCEAEWKTKFDLKMSHNSEMRTQLHRFAENNKKYTDLVFRINSVLEDLPNPKWRGSLYRSTYTDLVAFRNEYLANEPSKARLAQLLKADYSLDRAVQAPNIATTNPIQALAWSFSASHIPPPSADGEGPAEKKTSAVSIVEPISTTKVSKADGDKQPGSPSEEGEGGNLAPPPHLMGRRRSGTMFLRAGRAVPTRRSLKEV